MNRQHRYPWTPTSSSKSLWFQFFLSAILTAFSSQIHVHVCLRQEGFHKFKNQRFTCNNYIASTCLHLRPSTHKWPFWGQTLQMNALRLCKATLWNEWPHACRVHCMFSCLHFLHFIVRTSLAINFRYNWTIVLSCSIFICKDCAIKGTVLWISHSLSCYASDCKFNEMKKLSLPI